MNENNLASLVSDEQVQTSILEDPYEKEVQLDIWQHERKKTMYSLFITGLLLLGNNAIGLKFDLSFWLDILLLPVIFLLLGLFARVQPMNAAIGSIIAILAVTVINYLVLGPESLIMGWLMKAISLYFIIRAVQNAKEAEGARKRLRLLS